MRGSRSDPDRLPDWITAAYDTLEPHLLNHESGVTLEDGIEVLSSEFDDDLDLAEAEYAIQRLLDRGYLYEVDDQLYVTDPASES